MSESIGALITGLKVLLVIVIVLGVLSITLLLHKCPVTPPMTHGECDIRAGMLEDEVREMHRNNDKLRQYLLDDLLSEGRLPPIEDYDWRTK